jgi:hypothetical protein
MVQSPTERLTETAARAAVGADRVERDREAWNLPRAPVGTVTRRVRQRGLDWEDFRDLYYPGTRRHNFRAIVAYGAYKKSTPAGHEAASLEAWETEGGAAH